MADVAAIFCPKAPLGEGRGRRGTETPWSRGKTAARRTRTPTGGHRPIRPGCGGTFHPWDELIATGKVLALNMPAGSNPALARAIGVFLKNAWLQTLLRRPARMKQEPDEYFRPAVFICDEYQSFASVRRGQP